MLCKNTKKGRVFLHTIFFSLYGSLTELSNFLDIWVFHLICPPVGLRIHHWNGSECFLQFYWDVITVRTRCNWLTSTTGMFYLRRFMFLPMKSSTLFTGGSNSGLSNIEKNKASKNHCRNPPPRHQRRNTELSLNQMLKKIVSNVIFSPRLAVFLIFK